VKTDAHAVYLDGQQAVLYRSLMNRPRGRNFDVVDPHEWLACMADHIPDPDSAARASTASAPVA
jgi:hypothetical protein